MHRVLQVLLLSAIASQIAWRALQANSKTISDPRVAKIAPRAITAPVAHRPYCRASLGLILMHQILALLQTARHALWVLLVRQAQHITCHVRQGALHQARTSQIAICARLVPIKSKVAPPRALDATRATTAPKGHQHSCPVLRERSQMHRIWGTALNATYAPRASPVPLDRHTPRVAPRARMLPANDSPPVRHVQGAPTKTRQAAKPALSVFQGTSVFMDRQQLYHALVRL